METFLEGTLGSVIGAIRNGGAGRSDWATARERPLSIAIVNNMPDPALVATERQFSRLVRTAAGEDTEIRLYNLSGIARGDEARKILAERYQPANHLYRSRPDAIIVTGNEPRAARLDDEPYWQELTELVDWVRDSGSHSLWSCLAAHAAVLHLDGLERRRLSQKKSGVLTCAVYDPQARLPATLTVCHSRMNGLVKAELQSHGYGIVSEAPGENVDIFTKRYSAPFLFLQGHPEYEADSLMREYRRDVGRYLNGQRDSYPEMPENYFDSATVLRMENYRTLAERSRDIRLFEAFPEVSLRRDLPKQLQSSAAAVFSNWIASIAAEKLAA
jgi:homoserine O-succinyltransferase